MKRIISLMAIMAFAFILTGAGCASRNAQYQNEEQKAVTEEKNKAPAKDTGVTQEDLDSLKNSIQSLDIQDLSEIKEQKLLIFQLNKKPFPRGFLFSSTSSKIVVC